MSSPARLDALFLRTALEGFSLLLETPSDSAFSFVADLCSSFFSTYDSPTVLPPGVLRVRDEGGSGAGRGRHGPLLLRVLQGNAQGTSGGCSAGSMALQSDLQTAVGPALSRREFHCEATRISARSKEFNMAVINMLEFRKSIKMPIS